MSRLLQPPKPAPRWASPPNQQTSIHGLIATLTNQTPPTPLHSIHGCPATITSPSQSQTLTGNAPGDQREFKFLKMFVAPTDTASNLPRETWATEQRKDERLGPIIRYLTRTTTDTVDDESAPDWVKIAAQSYSMQQGILKYRALRKVGQHECNMDWVVAVPSDVVTHQGHSGMS